MIFLIIISICFLFFLEKKFGFLFFQIRKKVGRGRLVAVGFIIKGEGASKNRQRILTEGERQRERGKYITMEETTKKTKKKNKIVINEEDDSKKKERHFVTWSQQVSSPFSLSLYSLFSI